MLRCPGEEGLRCRNQRWELSCLYTVSSMPGQSPHQVYTTTACHCSNQSPPQTQAALSRIHLQVAQHAMSASQAALLPSA